MSSTLNLAHGLDRLSEAELRYLLEVRPLRKSAPDTLSLATSLLSRDSIQHVLTWLSTDEIRALVRLNDGHEVSEPLAGRLRALALIGERNGQPQALPEISSALTKMLAARGLSAGDYSAEESAEPATEHDHTESVTNQPGREAHTPHDWYAAALTEVARVAVSLRGLAVHPGRIRRRQQISASTIRDTAQASGWTVDEAAQALHALLDAGLLAETDLHDLTVSAESVTWLHASHVERWVALAKAHWQLVPTILRDYLASAASVTDAVTVVRNRFPLLAESDHESLTQTMTAFERIGLTLHGRFTAAGRALAAGDERALAEAATQVFPDLVAGVYIQPDLTVIVPGLVPADVEEFLWIVTDIEQLGLAQTLRLNPASIARGIDAELGVETIREKLTELSLTGIPQPLDYMLAEFEKRDRILTVSPTTQPGSRTRIHVSDEVLREQLLVDRALTHLSFTKQRDREDALFSPLSPEHVAAALREARYTVSRTDRDAERTHTESITIPINVIRKDPATEPINIVDQTVAGVLSNETTEDLPRILELAIREGTVLNVTAESRGKTYEFMLKPLGLAGGRLRARDEAADAERTIPLSAITSVEPR